MAYAALVRCAGANGLNVDTVSDEALVLSWYCVRLLLDAVNPDSQSGGHGKVQENESSSQDTMSKERLHRLYLTLISAMPSLPLALMLRALEEIKTIITSIPSPSLASISLASSTSSRDHKTAGEVGARAELVKALFQEIMENVGYVEKSAAMHWWYENRMELLSTQAVVSPASVKVDGTALTAS